MPEPNIAGIFDRLVSGITSSVLPPTSAVFFSALMTDEKFVFSVRKFATASGFFPSKNIRRGSSARKRPQS